MTDPSTALRETTYQGSKDDRRSPFFSPTKKLSKVFAKSISLDPLRAGPSSRPSRSRPSTALSEERSTTSSSLSPSSGGPKKSKSPTVASTHVVSSILNGMYAYPTSLRASSFSPQSTRQVLPPSPLLNNFPEVSMTISHDPRTSSETRSQYSVGLDRVLPSTDSHAATEMSDPYLDTKSRRVSQTVDSSIPTLSDCSAATSSSASHGSESQASTSNISQGSTSSSSSTSTLRVVGRGGSGSRLRLVTSAPENLDPARLRKDHLPIVRPIGRGGLGSRPKILEVSSLPSRDALQSEQAGHEPLLIRPIGRGGLGSRQKPLKSPSSLPTIWSKRSPKSLKGKEKRTAELRAIHPIPPHQSWRVSGGTTSTLSSIHFVGESDHPAYVSPFSLTNESMDSVGSPISRPRSLSDPSLSSFTFPASQSTSATTVDDDGEVDEDDAMGPKKVDHRQKSLNKLTRTLGHTPPGFFDSLNGGRFLRKDHPPKLFLDGPLTRPDKNAKTSRRSSLSVTNLSSIFARPSSRRRDSVASHHSASTITDDPHGFRAEANSSEQWGSRGDSIGDSGRSPSPESPIMFAPPSPAPAYGLTSKSPDLNAPAEPEQEDDPPYVPSPTLSRSFSYTPLSRRRSAIASHSHSASASLLTVRSDSSALTPNWMIPPSLDDEEVVFALTHHIPEKPQMWTGEWNGDLQHVIKALRTLH